MPGLKGLARRRTVPTSTFLSTVCAAAGLLLATAATASAQRRPPAPAREPPAFASPSQLDADAGAARAAVTAFITAEAQGSAQADTLLASDVDFIMTGIRVTARPRLAGLNGPGTATVEDLT